METILDQYVAVIGLDWADKKHDICLLDQTMSKPCFTVIKHAPEDIDEWVVSLLRKYSGQRIALCVELSKGPIISALLKYDFIDIYPVNPKTLSKYRETFSISGAKSDPGDAFLQMDFLLLIFVLFQKKRKKRRPSSGHPFRRKFSIPDPLKICQASINQRQFSIQFDRQTKSRKKRSTPSKIP